EGTDGMYFFSQPSGCSLHQNRCHPYRSYRLFGENETTPLLIAIMKEDVDMVRLLIQYGATFVPEGELCQEYLKELSSWTIRKLLEDAYGGKTHG
ncbi:MAG: ankyrin repeat domain-containing protein, partial [Firmicutes bacterium]|nr:ankyrin repeat domain-containing protein [Bacillota bacterium]